MSEIKDKAKEVYELYKEKLALELFINNSDVPLHFEIKKEGYFSNKKGCIYLSSVLIERTLILIKDRIKEIDEILNKL